MVGNKKKIKKNKNGLTDEEKLVIKEIKSQLQVMGIPRERWSLICQEELSKRRASNKKSKMPKMSGTLGKAVEKVTGKLAGNATKLLGINQNEQNNE